VEAEVRPLTEADVDAARAVQTAAFQEHDRRFGETPREPTPQVVERQRQRVAHFLTHDPGGSWVAEVGGDVVGVALASRRDGLWGLSLLAVDPHRQSNGIGRRLLSAALGYAEPGRAAVILSSRDPRAMHRYASAGFDLHPQMRAAGAVPPQRLPALTRQVREATAADAPLLDEVDLVVRGARRGPDHTMLRTHYAPAFVVDDVDGRGYAYAGRAGSACIVSATDDDTASALLWRCLAHDVELGRESAVEHVTAAQQWAVRIVVAAGLSLQPSGPVFWRGGTPPRSYLPSGAYL
jgi:predicted N-acetyltransferase YhbS